MAYIATSLLLPNARADHGRPDNPISDPPILIDPRPPTNPSVGVCPNPGQAYPSYTTLPVGPNGTGTYHLWTYSCVDTTDLEQLTGIVVPVYGNPFTPDANVSVSNYSAVQVGSITNPQLT